MRPNSLKLNISAIVVGYNEANLLGSCLNSISFCDEILYFDLGSTDDSIKIAKTSHATIINHEKVPGCEWIHSKYYQSTKHDWVLIIDPDEIINDLLINEELRKAQSKFRGLISHGSRMNMETIGEVKELINILNRVLLHAERDRR